MQGRASDASFRLASPWPQLRVYDMEENQFLACPPHIARTLPDDLLKLMGYQIGFGYGHAGAQADPLAALKQQA